MKISLSKVYHFLAKEKMFNKINNFSSKMKFNRSKTIRLIIETMMPLLDYYIIFEQESGEFGYNEFGAEVDVKFYIDSNIYRKLRNAHGTMHTFSIAALVRKMVELFFILVESKGLEWVINKMKYSIKKMISIICKSRRLYKNPKKMVHMYGKDLIKEHISLTFSENYTLLGIEYTKKHLSFNH